MRETKTNTTHSFHIEIENDRKRRAAHSQVQIRALAKDKGPTLRYNTRGGGGWWGDRQHARLMTLFLRRKVRKQGQNKRI